MGKLMDRIDKISELDFLIDKYNIDPKHLKSLYIECNTIDIDMNSELYRIMSFERLKQSLENKCLSMSKPQTWVDPFETFLMNYRARLKDGRIVGFQQIRDRIYCQCWSLRKECEGLWKVHTKDYQYVRIKTTAGKLMEYLYDTNNIFHYLSYFIGRVTYVEEDFIMDLLKEGVGSYFTSIMSSYMAIVHSLLIKRKAFEYEDEVRIIFNVHEKDDVDFSKVINKWNLKNNYFDFKIDTNDLIEEITFHPYLKEEDCVKFEQEIRAREYNGIINHSTLYTKKDMIVDF